MAPLNVDTRKLKDQAAELLGKSKFDKAAELLEQLVRAEPREMQHRLKLGDTWRRLGATEKAIHCYQIAGRHFGEESQLIKAIGAFKVILEIDPKNETAQRDLAEMNARRFAKPTLESAGLRAPQAIGAGARAASERELAANEKAAAGISALIEGGRASFEMPAEGDDDVPLELDVPAPRGANRAHASSVPSREPANPAAAKASPTTPAALAKPPGAGASRTPPPEPRRGPPPKLRPSIDLGASSGPGILGEPELELAEELEPLDEALPAPDAPPAPGTPAPAWRSTASSPKSAPQMAPGKPTTAAPAHPPIVPPAPALRAAPAARPRLPQPELHAELIELDPFAFAPPARAPLAAAGPPASGRAIAQARPIADLLTDGADDGEEIELVSISSDDAEPSAPRGSPPSAASGEELDAAFNAIAPEPPKPAPRRPAKVPLFDDLPPQAFLELVNRLSYKRWSPGEVILREGEPGRSFFVIVEGQVRVFKKLPDGSELPLATLGEGAFFGEMALLSGAPRAANVAAVGEVELLEISDQVLREVVAHYPTVAQSLKSFYRQRLVNNVMATSPMFKEFDPAERRGLVEKFKMKQAAAGEVLIREKQQSDGLYVVLHGGVRVVKRLSDGREVELAQLKEGELFGEMSLLTNEPTTATVSAVGPTILLKLHSDQFQELILTHPQILELVSDLVDQRRTHIAAVLDGHGPGHDGMSFV